MIISKLSTRFFMACFFLTGLVLNAQNVVEKSSDEVKMFNAKQKMFAGDYRSALNLFKEVFENQPDKAVAAYYTGECYFLMENYEDALDYLNKAKQKDANAHENMNMLLGRIYHIKGDLDAAMSSFESFKSSLKQDSLKEKRTKEVEYYLAQVKTAKILMAKPVNATVENMGDNINSKYKDKAPLITPDGKTFIFTSRRPGGKVSGIDVKGDGKYFENIFFCHWEDSTNSWSVPEPAPGSLNTEFHDAASSLSKDGLLLYTYMSDTESKTSRAGDIFVAKYNTTSAKWGKPKSIGKPINSSYYDDGACSSPTGDTIYFFSDRTGGLGGTDIYMSKKIGKSEWAEPVNLGPVINTEEDEGAIYLSNDGKTMYFASKGHNSMGSYDIFKSELVNGKWEKPVNMGYPINSVKEDLNFYLLKDGKSALMVSDRDGGFGERDIYRVTFK